MNSTPMKSKIRSLLHFSRQQEQQFVENLPEAERNAAGTPDFWAAKDVLGNIMTWKQLQTQKLAMAVRGETPPVWRDMHVVRQINDEAFVRYQGKSFQEIQKEEERIFSAFIAQVERLSEAQLEDPDLYDWQDREPLWEETLGNGLWHPATQLTNYSLKRDDKQSALQVQETLLAAVRRAELPREELGGAVYNQACFFARNGWPEKALLILPEAFHLRPTLVEVAKQDADLDSLRADPAFQTLFQDQALVTNARAHNLVSPQEVNAGLSTALPPVILDVRGPGEFASGHVQGARNIALGQLARKLTQIPRDRLVVTYCNMHHRGESRGERSAALLREYGFQARTLDGGYPAWKDAGLPVEEQ